MCVSRAEDFTDGSTFHRVLWDDAQKGNSTLKLKADDKIRRVVLCSGKVYYDLLAERDKQGLEDVYLLRVEQLYPLPTISLGQELARFPKAEFVWCQEEPKNQGAWFFVEPEMEQILTKVRGKTTRMSYAGRKASASPATGLASRHKHEQETLVAQALGLN
jgi:2-oxoglutarate dehydrogenase E1 component